MGASCQLLNLRSRPAQLVSLRRGAGLFHHFAWLARPLTSPLVRVLFPRCDVPSPDQTDVHFIGTASLADVLHRKSMALHQGIDLLDHPLTLSSILGLRILFGFQEKMVQAPHQFLIPLLSHGLAWPSPKLLGPADVMWLLKFHVYMAFTAGPGVLKRLLELAISFIFYATPKRSSACGEGSSVT